MDGPSTSRLLSCNYTMYDKIYAWKAHVRQVSAVPEFVHHEWFVEWHLEVVERIAFELCAACMHADRQLVEVMVWLHDYGKILDFDNQYDMTKQAGMPKLTEVGFGQDFTKRAVDYVAWMDRKMEVDLHEAPIEVQIVASADGYSHMVGPFLSLHWRENPTLSTVDLMARNRAKLTKDWQRKIVLPEARAAFGTYYNFWTHVSAAELPKNFLQPDKNMLQL